MSNIAQVAKALMAPGRGILAADESTGTIGKRFEKIKLENTEENRRAYRELLFTTPACNQYISGAILYDESIRQSARDGRTFVEVLEKKGIIPGIKVDKGTVALAHSPHEKITEGLDGLSDRLQEYYKLGARFAKWRAVYTIALGSLPSENCLRLNAVNLANYAALCQENDIVPIVEPEVLMDGEHDIEACYEVTEDVLEHVFDELRREGVDFTGMLLKPNMILPGQGARKAAPELVAERTVACLKNTVPPEVAGVVFLSGGQSEEEACKNLSAITALEAPWARSFSFGRALQDSALETWRGQSENFEKAQQVFLRRAELASQSSQGQYNSSDKN